MNNLDVNILKTVIYYWLDGQIFKIRWIELAIKVLLFKTQLFEVIPYWVFIALCILDYRFLSVRSV